MANYHHRQLPAFSALLMGPEQRNELGFRTDRMQISYFNTNESWEDPLPHAHQDSDECYLVLCGGLVLEIEGEQVVLEPRDFCCLPRGTYHRIIQAHPPVECLIIRAPSGPDKRYLLPDGTSTAEKVGVRDIIGLLNTSDENTSKQK